MKDEDINPDFEPSDDEFEQGFNAVAAGSEVPPPEDEPPADDDTPPQDEPPADEHTADDDAPAVVNPKPDGKKTAIDVLEELAGADDEPPPDEPPANVQPPAQTAPTVPAGTPPAVPSGAQPPTPGAEASSPVVVPKIDASTIKAAIDAAKLGDIIVRAPGDDGVEADVNLKDFAEEYPEQAAIAVAIGQHMAEQAVQNAIQTRVADAIKSAVEKAVNPLQTQIATTNFWMDVQNPARDGSPGMPDALSVARSDGFKEWRDKQRPAIQRLCNSNDPEDAIAVLAAYKEASAREKKDKGMQANGRRHKKETDIHRESSRGRGSDVGGGGEDGDDFEDSFAREAAAAEERRKNRLATV